MAFSDFTYPGVLDRLGLTARVSADLFAGVPAVAAQPELLESLRVNGPLAAAINTGKARSEWLIAPVLAAFWWRYRGQISLYSGVEFEADPAAGLNRFCDFLIGRGPQLPDVPPPVLVVFEAKRENLNAAVGQCIAGMEGAVRYNRRRGATIDSVYGCTTTGSVWKFLRLSHSAVTLDLTEYSIVQVAQLLGVLTHIVGPVPEPVAA